MLHEEQRRPADQQDEELIATIKAVIEAVRWQLKNRSKPRNR
jgi:hypothetical protein